MAFLKRYVLPLRKINPYFFYVIKNLKPTRPTKQNQNTIKKSKQLPKHRNTVTHLQRSNIFFLFLINFSLWCVYVTHWGLGWFILLLTFRITAGTDVKSEACLVFVYILLIQSIGSLFSDWFQLFTVFPKMIFWCSFSLCCFFWWFGIYWNAGNHGEDIDLRSSFFSFSHMVI